MHFVFRRQFRVKWRPENEYYRLDTIISHIFETNKLWCFICLSSFFSYWIRVLFCFQFFFLKRFLRSILPTKYRIDKSIDHRLFQCQINDRLSSLFRSVWSLQGHPHAMRSFDICYWFSSQYQKIDDKSLWNISTKNGTSVDVIFIGFILSGIIQFDA